MPVYSREKVPVVCVCCGDVYFRSPISKNPKRCLPCNKAWLALNPPKRRKPMKPVMRGHLETVLPVAGKPHFDKKKGDWYMAVKVRKRGSDEPLVKDRIYLRIGAEATPEQAREAFTTTYARMELGGASSRPVEVRKKLARKKKVKRDDARSWRKGRDKNLGIMKIRVSRVMFRSHLPDPKVDKKKIYVGRYETLEEARAARKVKYKELQWQFVPCAVCGELPMVSNMRVMHISRLCRNRVQLPYGVRPLYQTKLWNLIFSKGTVSHAGRIGGEDLHRMGYLFLNKMTGNYGPRADVEFDFSLAAGYALKTTEEDPCFE